MTHGLMIQSTMTGRRGVRCLGQLATLHPGAAGRFAFVVRKQTEWNVDAQLTFSFFVQPRTSARGMTSPIFNVVIPTLISPI